MPSKGQSIFYRKKRMDQTIRDFPDNTQYWVTDGPDARYAIIFSQFSELEAALKEAEKLGEGICIIRATIASEIYMGKVGKDGRYQQV